MATNSEASGGREPPVVCSSDWHLITGEYPPQPGGVSDYTQLVAAGLANEGDGVHVWCPPATDETPVSPGVAVHRDLGRIGPRDLYRVGRQLNQFPAPRRLLVQWVPHGFGYRSMNLGFCLWLWGRKLFHGDEVQIMVHEPYLRFAGTWKQHAAAAIHRLMTIALLRAARTTWVGSPVWGGLWRPYLLGRKMPFTWLPVPSNVPVIHDPAGVAQIRAQYTVPQGCLLGHFGTYGQSMVDTLREVIPTLLTRHPNLTVLLLGRGGERLRDSLAQQRPDFLSRIHATGGLDAATLSRHLSACDLMVQPYPGGVDTRRGSMMATISHGLPVVTNAGLHTEALWADRHAASLSPEGDAAALVAEAERLLTDRAARVRLGAAAQSLYQDHFHVRHTVTALRTASKAQSRRMG